MYIYKWHEVDQTKHEIFCVHIVCNEIQVKVNLEITFFFYLRFPYCPNFFWFGVVDKILKKFSITSLAHQWMLCSEWSGYLVRSDGLKLKQLCFLQTCSFSLHKMLTDGLDSCELLVDYCDVFISSLDSCSDGTHSLQRIHWWASDEKLIYILDDLRVSTFSFWVNYFFKITILII